MTIRHMLNLGLRVDQSQSEFEGNLCRGQDQRPPPSGLEPSARARAGGWARAKLLSGGGSVMKVQVPDRWLVGTMSSA